MSEIREHPGLGLNQEGLLRLEKIAESGGVNPHFMEERVMMWVGRKNWVHDLSVSAH